MNADFAGYSDADMRDRDRPQRFYSLKCHGRTHVDLFTGLAGFSLAAKGNGVRTVVQVEIDKHCRAFLDRAWPDTEKHDDIRTFDGSRFAGAWLLTAGVPCQPASRAGQQRGAADDRWLWPAALSVLAAVRPTWALFENPPGIGDVGLAGILADVEALGYEVQVFGVPACAVGSPQRRERYWIVAHAQCRDESDGVSGGTHAGDRACLLSAEDAEHGDVADGSIAGHEGPDAEPGAEGRRTEHRQGDVADAGCEHGGPARPESQPNQPGADVHAERCGVGAWDSFVWLPCADGKVRRAIDDTQRMAHGLPMELLEELGTEGRQTPEECEVHRSLLGALGNAVVSEIPRRLIAAMIASEK